MRYKAKTPTNHERSMVCNQPYPAHGPAYPASRNGFPGTNRSSSRNTANTPKPPYSNNPRTANQKATAKKMDDRCELQR
jgi:hypothetical protein